MGGWPSVTHKRGKNLKVPSVKGGPSCAVRCIFLPCACPEALFLLRLPPILHLPLLGRYSGMHALAFSDCCVDALRFCGSHTALRGPRLPIPDNTLFSCCVVAQNACHWCNGQRSEHFSIESPFLLQKSCIRQPLLRAARGAFSLDRPRHLRLLTWGCRGFGPLEPLVISISTTPCSPPPLESWPVSATGFIFLPPSPSLYPFPSLSTFFIFHFFRRITIIPTCDGIPSASLSGSCFFPLLPPTASAYNKA